MKKLAIIFLCFLLTGCTYIGQTEAIRISSPSELAISRIETFGETTASLPVDTEPSTPPSVTAPASTSAFPISTTTSIPSTTPIAKSQLILSLNTKKIHYFDTCSYAKKIKDENRKVVDVSNEELLLVEGYTVCSWCAKH